MTACIVAPSLCHEETRGDPTAFFRIYYHDNRKLVWHVTWRLEPTKGQWRLDEAHTTLDTIPESCKEDIKTGVYDNIEDLAKMLGTFATAMS